MPTIHPTHRPWYRSEPVFCALMCVAILAFIACSVYAIGLMDSSLTPDKREHFLDMLVATGALGLALTTLARALYKEG